MVAWWNWSQSALAVRERQLAELRAELAELRETLAFVNAKHNQLAAQEGVPMQENAVLRFDLQRCQRDRLVLEAHLASARGELRMARAVPRPPLPADDAQEAARRAALRQLAIGLDALEVWRDQMLADHPQLAAGLHALPPEWEELRRLTGALQAALLSEEREAR
jgi:chromosome segregation ATPase